MVCLLEGGSLPSSEAAMVRPLEGRFATLERGGDAGRSRGSRWETSSEAEITPRVRGGVRMGRVLGFFESLSFFQIWNEAVGLRGLSCLICVCVFRVVLVPRLGYP